MFGADRGGDRVEMPHALDEPGQFVGGDRKKHTSELQSLMRSSYAVFCLKTKRTHRVARLAAPSRGTRSTTCIALETTQTTDAISTANVIHRETHAPLLCS